jgi:hypothetical protein
MYMGVIKNIKASIDDKSSMSVNSISVLGSTIITIIMGLVVSFVVIYDATYDGKVDSDIGELSWLLIASSGCILGSGIPKAYIDSKMKTRSWVENERMQIEVEEDLEDYKAERRRKRRDKEGSEDITDEP